MTETSYSIFILLLIMIHRNLAETLSGWNASYSLSPICALEGSSVNMFCSYTYPTYAKVTEAFWTTQNSGSPADLLKDEIYTHRVIVNCGSKQSQCSLNMTKLTKTDAHYQYYCRIITDYQLQKYTAKPGISLIVTGLEVVSSVKESEMQEGDNVTLTCNTTCHLTGSPSFIWSKDGRLVEKKQIIYNQLQLHSVSYEDKGNYTCAVRGQEHLLSPPMRIRVKCPTDVSSNMKDVREGDNVTLTCNTTCNVAYSPSFIWSKDGRPEEKKQIINNQLHLHPVSYEDEGSYTCAVRGHEDPSSPSFKLTVMVGRSSATAVLVGVVACGVAGLFCVVLWLRSHNETHHKTQKGDTEDQDDVQNPSTDLQSSGDRRRAVGPPSVDAVEGEEDDVQYASVQSNQSRQTAGAQGDEVQYASVQLNQSRQTAAQGDEVQFASVQLNHSSQTAGAQ